MMTRFQAVRHATKAFDKWLDDATVCKELFLTAEMPVPEILAELCGNGLTVDGLDSAAAPVPEYSHPSTSYIGALPQPRKRRRARRRDPDTLKTPFEPPSPPRPRKAAEDWIYIRTIDASPRNLTIAVLYQSEKALSAADINKDVNYARKSRKQTAAGYNALHRLRLDRDIEGDMEGFKLINGKLKGIIQDDWLWLPPSQLTDQDRASIRRRAILLAIHENGPLSAANITRVLDRCRWLRIPVTRDAAKGDLYSMELDHRVRQIEDKLWEVVPAPGEEPFRVASQRGFEGG